jgi:hypothetical protein
VIVMSLGYIILICGLTTIGLTPVIVGSDPIAQIAMTGFGFLLILVSSVCP